LPSEDHINNQEIVKLGIFDKYPVQWNSVHQS